MKAFQIKNWNSIFENNDSRKLKKLSWVPVPTKWDGLGYVKLMKHKGAVSIFAGWSLIIQIGSKCPHRGLLANADRPLSAEDMSDLTRMPKEVFERALDVLSKPEEGIGWIEVVDIQKNEGGDWEISRNLPEPPDASGKRGVEQNRTEQKGTEENNIEQKAEAELPFDSVAFKLAWNNWDEHLKQKKIKRTPLAIKQQIKRLSEMGENRAIACIENSIAGNYQGLFEDKSYSGFNNKTKIKEINASEIGKVIFK